MRKTAKILSIIFHPIIFAVLLPFVVMYHNTRSLGEGIEWLGLAAFFIILAFLVFIFAKPLEILNDIDISDRKLRPFFYTTSLIFALIYFLIAVLRRGIVSPLGMVSLGIVLGIAVFEIVNYFIKASVHVAVACAFTITIGLLYGNIIFFPALIIPIGIIFSRLYLKKHTVSEVIAGGTLGSLVCILTFIIAKIIL